MLACLSERLDSNWKCHCIALKIPLPSCFFLGGAESPKAESRPTARTAKNSHQVHFLNFSLQLWLTFSISAPDTLPFLSLSRPTLLPIFYCMSLRHPSSHAVCTTVSSISSVNPSLACRLRYFVFYRETGWVREKRRGKRLADVQLYIYQCSEPNTRSALGYVLNRKAKRKRKGEKQEGVCDGLPSCQKATTDGTACFYLWSQNGLNHFFI